MSKLTDKAKNISFDDEDEAPAAAPAPVDRPRTATDFAISPTET